MIKLKIKNFRNYYKKIVTLVAIIIAMILVSFYFISSNFTNIHYGIYIGENNLGGVSKEKAEEVFLNYIEKDFKEQSVILKAGKSETKVGLKDLISDFNLDKNINKLYNYKRDKIFILRAINIIFKKNERNNFKFDFKYNEKVLNSKLKKISDSVYVEQKLPDTKIEGGNLYLKKGKPEIKLNKEKSFALILDNISSLKNEDIQLIVDKNYKNDFEFEELLKLVNKDEENADIEINGNFDYKITNDKLGYKVTKKELKKAIETSSYENKEYVKLDAEFTKPKINYNTYKYNLFKDTIYSYSTEFNSEDFERTKNLLVAAEKINGKVIKSGEVFSFDEVVGEITPDNGFYFAKVYQDGMIALGVGGGICQIASTLHNTVLRIPDLQILERSNHSFTVSYVDPGFDAAISNESNKNYVFKNNFNFPIKILANVNDNTLQMTIKGTKERDTEVEIWSEVVYVIPYETVYRDISDLSEGVEFVKSEPKNGAVVDTYIKVLENGKEIENKKIYTSEYTPLNNYEFY